jgi:hypothetical protein
MRFDVFSLKLWCMGLCGDERVIPVEWSGVGCENEWVASVRRRTKLKKELRQDGTNKIKITERNKMDGGQSKCKIGNWDNQDHKVGGESLERRGSLET